MKPNKIDKSLHSCELPPPSLPVSPPPTSSLNYECDEATSNKSSTPANANVHVIKPDSGVCSEKEDQKSFAVDFCSKISQPTTSKHQLKREIDDFCEQDQIVLKLRRISTPAYALKQVEHKFCAPYGGLSTQRKIPPVVSDENLIPNPNKMNFNFNGHHRLYPYRFYLDLITRAKRDSSVICLEMPKLRPAGGTIIVYDCRGIDQNRALHNDGYRWGRSKGVKLIQSVNNKLVRTYHFLYDPKKPAGDPTFKKYRFTLREESYGVMVMHYIGNEKHAVEVSARCMRNNDPMALLAYAEAERDTNDPQELNLLPLPERNRKPLEAERLEYRRVILANVQSLQQQLLYDNSETFIERFEFYEDDIKSIFLFCYPLVEQLIAVGSLLHHGATPFRAVQLLYHSEPLSVNYLLSTVAFVHPLFEGDRVMPIAFMISPAISAERSNDHDVFLSTLYTHFSEFANIRFALITGQNLCFSSKSFPVVEHMRCWEDFKRVKLSFIELNFNNVNLCDYANDMNILMSCTYERLFDEMWKKISASKRYTERPDLFSYFENVWSEFKATSSVWHLKACGVPEADKGVIWKVCKGLSRVVTDLCETGAELDTVIVSLFLLSNAYRRLFIAGLHQSGAWRLKKCYKERFQQSHLKLPKLPYAPSVDNVVSTAFGMCPGRQFKKVDNLEAENASFHSVINIPKPISFCEYPTSSLVTWDSHQHVANEVDITTSKLPLNFQSCSTQSVNPITFVVRNKDGSSQIVEAVYQENAETPQWYCSCGLKHKCSHIESVLKWREATPQ